MTDADLAAVNIPPQNRPENEGTFTWTLTDGAWTNLQTADHPIQYPTASGVYIADGDHVTFFVASDLGPQEFTWKVEPNGDLILSAEPSTSGFYAAFLGAHPLVKVS
ncbi:MAG: hypothetical protein JWL72_1017 [Ilumatobacteraceae bacterium]|nr:hypothetical protein [Ilumatobacteraceae bacterium]